ncbi:DUF6338 family protein [Roseivivax sediminis]|uniref:DUF6338 family protein n=1 Tax=Roseivivax sediminis TaxID=936889 RepID=UPI00122CAA04|nr:DUF6338 family protein [Roseivivax sediminis]
MQELLSLSWQTQAVLIGGYLAYVIAYSGRRMNHRAFDAFAIVLVFGGFSLISLSILDSALGDNHWKHQISGVVSVVFPCLIAIAWRRFLKDWVSDKINLLAGAQEDGLPTAWDTVIQTQDVAYCQLIVSLKDGRSLESFPLGDYNDLPNGPCVLGSDGSVAMYVTHIFEKNESRPATEITNDLGSRLTYIPADQIAEVDFRREARRK